MLPKMSGYVKGFDVFFNKKRWIVKKWNKICDKVSKCVKGKNYDPQVFLEKCKNIVKEKR